jgi:hypothetical protein
MTGSSPSPFVAGVAGTGIDTCSNKHTSVTGACCCQGCDCLFARHVQDRWEMTFNALLLIIMASVQWCACGGWLTKAATCIILVGKAGSASARSTLGCPCLGAASGDAPSVLARVLVTSRTRCAA